MTFVKEYASPARATAARTHWQWLASLDSGLRLPRLYPGHGNRLVFERLDGRFPRPADLVQVAGALGSWHAVAYLREFRAAQLNRPFRSGSGLVIADFPTPRPSMSASLVRRWSGLPAALYKDTNLRNVILTADRPALVDFDDLTLAPFGYDLAKLVVSTAMTHGRIPEATIAAALDVHNCHTTGSAGPAVICPLGRFRQFAEIHHQLTAAYLGRNGYRFPWPEVRPWPRPDTRSPVRMEPS